MLCSKVMAVPKKKMSKSKRNSRKFSWKNKVKQKIIIAFSLGKSLEDEKKFNFML